MLLFSFISKHFIISLVIALTHWWFKNAVAAKSLQSRPTLCDPIDRSPPGTPVPGILQARTLEWVAISFSSAWKWKVKAKSLSCARLFTTPWAAAFQTPQSMGSSRQEYWSGVPLPSPGNLDVGPIWTGEELRLWSLSSNPQTYWIWAVCPWKIHWTSLEVLISLYEVNQFDIRWLYGLRN